MLEQDNHLRGASAVIEKDLAAGKLAEGIDAEMLIILTNVEKVCINLGQKDEEPLGEITTEQAKTYMEEGHFGIYNMLPKFRASVDFVEECEGRSAYITSFDKVTDALKGKNRHCHSIVFLWIPVDIQKSGTTFVSDFFSYSF